MLRAHGLTAVLLTAIACNSRPAAPPAAADAAPPPPWAVTISPASVKIEANSSEPQLTRHAGGVVLSWVEQNAGGATLRFAERDGAGAWSAPQTAASGADWFLSWADVPSVSRLAGGTLVAQWLKNVDPLIEAYDLMLATSRDDGRTWPPPFSPHHDKTRTQHGFASLFRVARSRRARASGSSGSMAAIRS